MTNHNPCVINIHVHVVSYTYTCIYSIGCCVYTHKMILLIVHNINNTPGHMVQVICTMEVIQNEEIALWAAMISYNIMVLWISYNVLHALQRQCMTLFH